MRYKIHFNVLIRSFHDGSSKWQDMRKRATRLIDTLSECTISIRLALRCAITKPISLLSRFIANEISLAFHDLASSVIFSVVGLSLCSFSIALQKISMKHSQWKENILALVRRRLPIYQTKLSCHAFIASNLTVCTLILIQNAHSANITTTTLNYVYFALIQYIFTLYICEKTIFEIYNFYTPLIQFHRNKRVSQLLRNRINYAFLFSNSFSTSVTPP